MCIFLIYFPRPLSSYCLVRCFSQKFYFLCFKDYLNNTAGCISINIFYCFDSYIAELSVLSTAASRGLGSNGPIPILSYNLAHSLLMLKSMIQQYKDHSDSPPPADIIIYNYMISRLRCFFLQISTTTYEKPFYPTHLLFQ